MRQLISKNNFPKIDGTLFVGMVFVLCGAIVAWSGYAQAKELWSKASQFFPISLPNDVAERTLMLFPVIFKEIICAVSSLCAMLIGIMWFFSGLAETLRSLNPRSDPSNFGHSELVAESVRTGEAQYWRTSSFLPRLLGKIWGRARYVSPISYEFAADILRSSFKILLLGGAISVLFYFLRILPSLLQRYASATAGIIIPGAGPLYFLLLIALAVNLLIMLSLFPIRKRQFIRAHEMLSISGRGDPQVFFALLEEGCRLLTPSGGTSRAPIRLASKNGENISATLVENQPQSVTSIARPAGFLCLPFIFFPITMGFSRLIHFQRPASEMPYQVFLKVHALDYLLEVLFALGLIILGLYFAEWARKIFGIRKYRSNLVFCHSMEPSKAGAMSVESIKSQEWDWKVMDEVDESFAGWVRDPQSGKRFLLEVFWADVHSESAGSRGARYLVEMREDHDLNRSMWHILKLPFFVSFEAEDKAVQAESN